MTDKQYTVGSGNVFADMGLSDPEERLLKSRLAWLINQIIDHRGWTQQQAADRLGITQSQVSELKHGRLKRFSVERLLGLLGQLDREITVTIRHKSDPQRPVEHIVVSSAT